MSTPLRVLLIEDSDDAMFLFRATYPKSKKPDLPFIFVSGTLGEEAAVAAIKEGAQDYLSA
jgi:DNA-binding NtrC family response regulator